MVYGKNIIPFGEIRGIDVYDVTPTILYLAGIPVGEDMLGRPFLDFIDPRFIEKYPIEFIQSHGKDFTGTDEITESVLDEEIIDRFKSLGYIK